ERRRHEHIPAKRRVEGVREGQVDTVELEDHPDVVDSVDAATRRRVNGGELLRPHGDADGDLSRHRADVAVARELVDAVPVTPGKDLVHRDGLRSKAGDEVVAEVSPGRVLVGEEDVEPTAGAVGPGEVRVEISRIRSPIEDDASARDGGREG